MDLETFTSNMFCGMGRCYVVLRDTNKRETYRPAVAWGLVNKIGYHDETDETRGEYMYRLASLFDNPQDFLPKLIDAFLSVKNDEINLVAQLCEELKCFAQGGLEDAKKALRAKFLYLHSRMVSTKRYLEADPDEINHIVNALLCCASPEEAVDIAEMVGQLIEDSYLYDENAFEIVFHTMKSNRTDMPSAELLRALEARGNAYANAFVNGYKEYTADKTDLDFLTDTEEEPQNDFAIRPAKALDKGKVDDFLNAFNGLQWYRALRAMADSAYPEDPTPIIICAVMLPSSVNKYAYNVLCNTRHPRVRSFGIHLLEHDSHKCEAIRMIVHNDNALNHGETMRLLEKLAPMKTGYDAVTARLGVARTVAESERYYIHLPRDLYEYAYCNSHSSYVRYVIVRIMESKGWLSQEMIEECAFDSNEKLRDYVRKTYPILFK